MTAPVPVGDPIPVPAAPIPPADPLPDPKPDPGPDDAAKLKTALDRERQLRRDAEKRARDGDAHKAKLDELEAAGQSETEKAVTAARKEGAQEAIAGANARVVAAEARALAAEAKFRNPQLAVRAISDELRGIKVTDDGIVDTESITNALKVLAASEPYLIEETGPRPPRPDPSQGSGRPLPQSGLDGAQEAARRFGSKSPSNT